jgi:imidazolonepropionase-like amidohydrolase
MKRSTHRLTLLATLGAVVFAGGCTDSTPRSGSDTRISQSDTTWLAVTGATLIDGTGRDPIADAVLLIHEGRVYDAGPAGTVDIPADVPQLDYSGAWIIPGLINAHGHVGTADGLHGGPAVHTAANVTSQLGLYARYGITTVISLGDPGTHTLPHRGTRYDRELNHARLYTSGPVLSPDSTAEARNAVQAHADMGVDWIKIRVDDALGRVQKMPPDVYTAVIDAAHEHGLPVAAHIVDLEDAIGLLRSGVDLIGHSVRDAAVSEELIALMQERGVCLTPTFTRELSTFVYADRPDFFDDPFFFAEADRGVLEELQDPDRQAAIRNNAAARYFREALPVAERNMMVLHEAGVGIAMGTDSGPVARFQGYFEHLEMAMMQDAGMSPYDVLLSATSVAARCMGLTGVGDLTPGSWADFIVLDEDPLADIRGARAIREVRVAGNPVP